MTLEGYKTYITAAALFIIGLAGYIDPSAANFISQQIGVDSQTILMICALLMAGLRRITKA